VTLPLASAPPISGVTAIDPGVSNVDTVVLRTLSGGSLTTTPGCRLWCHYGTMMAP